MTRQELAQVIGRLNAAFPREQMSSDTAAVWLEVNGDLPFDASYSIAVNMLRTEERPPTPARFRSAVLASVRAKSDERGLPGPVNPRDPELSPQENARRMRELRLSLMAKTRMP